MISHSPEAPVFQQRFECARCAWVLVFTSAPMRLIRQHMEEVHGGFPKARDEWPHLMSNEADNIQKNAERQMAERIIARLEKADTPTGVYVSSWGLGIDRAIRIVREECGL